MSNGVDEILLTFRQEEHILIVAKNVMILTLAKTKTPEVCYTSGVFYSVYVGGLCLRLLCCLFVFSVQPFVNAVANYIYCDRDKD